MTQWRPLSDGKLVSGQAAVARILGGLTDDVLCASSLVVQRSSDRFTRAAREDRRRLIAEAAGLGIYGTLTEHAQAEAASAERELELRQSKADPLRARVELIEGTARELAGAREIAGAAATAIAEIEAEQRDAERALEKARGRAAEQDTLSAAAVTLHEELVRIEADLQKWKAKLGTAMVILAERKQLEAAKDELAKVQARIAEIEAIQERHAEQLRAVHATAASVYRLEAELAQMRTARQVRAKALDAQIGAHREQLDDLHQSGCLERCAHDATCTVLSKSKATATRIGVLEHDLAKASETTPEELALVERINTTELLDEPDTAGAALELRGERSKADVLVKAVAVADKLAAAEQVVKEHDEATTALRARQAELREQLAAKNAALLGFGGDPSAEVARAQAALGEVAKRLVEQRRTREAAVANVALLEGRLGTYEAAREELAGVEVAIAAAAQMGADQAELVRAWRAVRVSMLENSVLPAIEDTANELLRKFPYGLQLAFRTQRAKTSGDGTAESLDIEVLGGMGSFYELCSGGQKTALDVCLHLALSLVVSRRSSARLNLLSIDEPEGLDEPGRSAFAAILNYVADEFALQVICMSHHEDLVAQLGGRRIEIQGEPGNARVVLREAVPA